jgi:hypothetical protein
MLSEEQVRLKTVAVNPFTRMNGMNGGKQKTEPNEIESTIVPPLTDVATVGGKGEFNVKKRSASPAKPISRVRCFGLAGTNRYGNSPEIGEGGGNAKSVRLKI